MHQIQSFPPSLSDFRKLHLPSMKSDLVQCLKQPGQSEPPSTCDRKVQDGAIIVHCLPTKSIASFHENANQTGCLNHTLRSSCRIPQGWMMSGTRTSQTVQRRVPGEGEVVLWAEKWSQCHTKLPRNWMDFLHNPIHKGVVYLCVFKGCRVQLDTSHSRLCHIRESCCIHRFHHPMQNCNHEEPDTSSACTGARLSMCILSTQIL